MQTSFNIDTKLQLIKHEYLDNYNQNQLEPNS